MNPKFALCAMVLSAGISFHATAKLVNENQDESKHESHKRKESAHKWHKREEPSSKWEEQGDFSLKWYEQGEYATHKAMKLVTTKVIRSLHNYKKTVV